MKGHRFADQVVSWILGALEKGAEIDTVINITNVFTNPAG